MNPVAAVMYREFRIRTTSLTWLFFDLIVPLAYLLLFGIALDRTFAGGLATHDTTLSYNAFFLAGVLSMACFGIAINTSYGFFVDRDNGIFYEFLTYPDDPRAVPARARYSSTRFSRSCRPPLRSARAHVVLGIDVRWDLVPLALVGVGRRNCRLGLLPLVVRPPDPAERHVQHVHQRRVLRHDVRLDDVLSPGSVCP